MSNEITIKNQDLVAVIEDRSLSELLKPLVNEIHLFDTYIAGTAFINDETVFDSLETGTKLTLQREDNKFDERAIMILNENHQKLGYVPKKDNVIFSRLMDAGKLLTAKVASAETQGSFRKIRIGIYLVDY